MANVVRRFVTEYAALGRVLAPADVLALAVATVTQAPAILRTRKLSALDSAMSRDLTVAFDGARVALPLNKIDKVLAGTNDNPTFGNVREIYARNCYLEGLSLKKPARAVLDAGANRGMFSILALVYLNADIVVGVEPTTKYLPVNDLLLQANGIALERCPRYVKFLSSASAEQENPEQNISIKTILREQKIDRFNFVKMDIEGFEKMLFEEPDWLAYVDTIAMELHPHFQNMEVVPRALKEYGFAFRMVDQSGAPADAKHAMFLQASCTGELS